MLITDDITIAAATSSSTKNFNAQMSNIHHDRRHHDVEQFCIIIGSGIGGLCQASASIKLKSKLCEVLIKKAVNFIHFTALFKTPSSTNLSIYLVSQHLIGPMLLKNDPSNRPNAI
jgi:hypothetical protein